MAKSTVYIITEDGLVQSVFSTDADTEVILCDLDTFDADEKRYTEATIDVARATAYQVY
jgi:hypothetical protein